MDDGVKKFLSTIGITVGAYAGYGVMMLFIDRLCELLGDSEGAEVFSVAVGIGLMLLVFKLVKALIEMKPKKIKEELKEKRNDFRRKLIYSEYANKIPHFGQMLTPKQILEVVKKDKFMPYVNPSGETIDCIQVNETDKWVKILDQYFPLDLIYGYNIDRNVLYAIDGTEFELPEQLKRRYIDQDLKRFLAERGCFYDWKLESDFSHFFEVFPGYIREFSKADWSYIRYKWEKAAALENSPKVVTSCSYRDFYGLVLSKTELEAVVKEIHEGTKDLSELLKADAYANEYSLCNGIELLGMLDESYRLQGIDFLFDCLSDVDEACFRMAMPQILRLPDEVLIPQIEARAEQAYLDNDALRLAGLLYLAKEIGYKIEYIENLKDADPELEEAQGFIAEDEEENSQPKGFEAGGGYAYLKE